MPCGSGFMRSSAIPVTSQDRRRNRHTRPVRHVPVQLARLAEGAVPGGLFAEILRLIAELRPQPVPA